MKAHRKAVLGWASVAFAAGFVTTFGIIILTIDFYVSTPGFWGCLGLSALLTMAGTWAWRNRDDRRPTPGRAALTAGVQVVALALGYLAAVEAFDVTYPPNFT